MKRFIASLIAVVVAHSVSAQSSLGIQGTDLRFGALQDETGEVQVLSSLRLDVTITDAHGLQGDVTFEDTGNGLVGGLGTRLYMAPVEHQKYGLFASLSDVDGRSMSWLSVGAEGMFAAGDDLVFEARAGMGVSDVEGLDYIFADGGFAIALSDNLAVETHLTVAEFEEASFQAISYDAGASLHYTASGSPWGTYASINYSGLTGRDSRPGELRVGFGVSMSFGQIGGLSPKTRPFRIVNPVAPLVRRGLW